MTKFTWSFFYFFYWISGIFYSKFRSNNKLSVNRALNINLFRNLCDHFATFSSHKLNRWKMTKPSQPSFWSMAKIFAVVQSNYDTIHFLVFLKKIEPSYVLFHDLSFISKNLIQNNNRKNLIRKKRFNFSNSKNTKKKLLFVTECSNDFSAIRGNRIWPNINFMIKNV